jgi:LacI family transcriptional regulator
MKSKATLKELARELGVSISTVSKALSDSPEISEFTKTKIKEFAQLKNYKPNSLAKNLKNQRSFTIGVILPNILNPFFAKVFSGIEEYANNKGYNLITSTSNESLKKEIEILDLLDNGSIDGFIMSLAEETQKENNTEHIKNILKGGTPIVLFDRISPELKCDKVIVNDFESALQATEYLQKTNCKKIALVSSIENLSVGKLRRKGFESAFDKQHDETNKDLILLTENEEEFDAKIDDFFKHNSFDAIFALDEHSAVTVMKKALLLGKKIPDDISVIGFADGLWSRRLTPSLSTISQHAPEIGMKTAELLINRIEKTYNPEEEQKYVTETIETELRKRDSVKKL